MDVPTDYNVVLASLAKAAAMTHQDFDTNMPVEPQHVGLPLASNAAQNRLDGVTGLFSRDGFFEAYDVAAASGAQLIAMHLDLEGFQTINHHHGFQQGDAVLCAIAQKLTSILPGTASIGRVSGSEFVLLITGDRPHGEYITKRIISACNEPIPLATGGRATINVRAGWVFGAAGPDQQLLREATLALHEAKSTGARIVEFVEKLAVRVAQRRQTEIELRTAVVNEQFVLHGQPMVDVFEQRIEAIELLLRWRHPEVGMLTPDRFLPIAEECDFIDDIDQWVVRQLVTAAVLTHPTVHFAVNLSTRSISKPTSLRYISEMLRNSGVPTGRMHAELNQSERSVDSALVVESTKKLVESGVGITIDRFGDGYASLATLMQMSATTVKLDRSLTIQVDSPDGRGIVSAIMGFAQHRGLRIVAAGVETESQAEALKELGCRYQQGNYHQPVADLDEVLSLVGRKTEPARVPTLV